MPIPNNREAGTPGDDVLTGEPGARNTLIGRAGGRFFPTSEPGPPSKGAPRAREVLK